MRKATTGDNTVSFAAARTLKEIQSNRSDVCTARYHEYHRPRTEHGFTSTIVAKKSRR